jgi:OHCU decarboxylase
LSISLTLLNAAPAEEAAEYLRSCCGSSRWVAAMVARRPFQSREALFQAADEIWRGTTAADWDEAFAEHPRIGERARQENATARDWSADEQRAAAADASRRAQLLEANLRYERIFGRTYIVCASGRSASDILSDIEARMGNEPDVERRTAAEEQRKITRLRLEKLVTH